MKTATITTQQELRAEFWAQHPDAKRRPGSQNAQPCDTRVAWVDFVDAMARDGVISESMANRATL